VPRDQSAVKSPRADRNRGMVPHSSFVKLSKFRNRRREIGIRHQTPFTGRLQHSMPNGIALPLIAWILKETKATVCTGMISNDFSRCIVRAVVDDYNL
jgi:hypothetical protein